MKDDQDRLYKSIDLKIKIILKLGKRYLPSGNTIFYKKCMVMLFCLKNNNGHKFNYLLDWATIDFMP